jgi:hypothetical protein
VHDSQFTVKEFSNLISQKQIHPKYHVLEIKIILGLIHGQTLSDQVVRSLIIAFPILS